MTQTRHDRDVITPPRARRPVTVETRGVGPAPSVAFRPRDRSADHAPSRRRRPAGHVTDRRHHPGGHRGGAGTRSRIIGTATLPPPPRDPHSVSPQPRDSAGQGVLTLRRGEPRPGLRGASPPPVPGTGPTRRPYIPRSPLPAEVRGCPGSRLPAGYSGSPGFWGIPVDGPITNKPFGYNIKHKTKVRRESFIISKGQNWPRNCSQGT